MMRRSRIALAAALLAFFATAASAAAFSQPKQLYSKHGVMRATFVARAGDVTMAGKRVAGGMTINGQFPAPTLNVHAGDTIKIKFVNKLVESTNIHFHGLHVSPAGISDNIFRRFKNGGTYEVVVKIPHDHPNGLFWYHPHLHGSVNDQVLRGYAGMISVSGGSNRVKSLDKFRGTQIGLNLTQFSADGKSVVNPNDESDASSTTTVNGQVGQTLSMRPGETRMLRIANMSNEGFYKLQLDGHELWVVRIDGNPVRVAQRVSTILLAPGSRYEVLVKAGAAGDYKLRQLPYFEGFNNFPAQDLLTLTVAGATTKSQPVPHHVKSFEDLSRAKVAVRRNWVLSFSPDSAPVFKAMINGKTFDPQRIDSRAKLGQVEEWTFINETSEDHPIHLHTNDFQVVAVNGQRRRPAAPIDNTILPRNGSISVRFRPQTYTGLAVFHCHILFHEDSGMMATIRYLPASAKGSASVVEPAGVSVHDEAVAGEQIFEPAGDADASSVDPGYLLFCRLYGLPVKRR